MPAATRKIGCTRASAADICDFQQVGVRVGVSSLGRVDLILIDAGMKITCTYYREVLLTQNFPKCPPCTLRGYLHRNVCATHHASSLSSSKAMLLLTDHARQSIFWNDRPLRSFHQIFGHPAGHIIISRLTKKYGRNATASLRSSCS